MASSQWSDLTESVSICIGFDDGSKFGIGVQNSAEKTEIVVKRPGTHFDPL